MKKRSKELFLLALFGVRGAFAQTYLVEPAGRFAHLRGHIVTAFADEDTSAVDKRRCCSTGNLHIIYSDGTTTLIRLQGPADFSNIEVAPDRQTVGWTSGYYNNDTYTFPLDLSIVRQGRFLLQISGKAPIRFWEFLAGGLQAGTIRTQTPTCGTYTLFDLKTRATLATHPSDHASPPCLAETAPGWARQLDRDYQASMAP